MINVVNLTLLLSTQVCDLPNPLLIIKGWTYLKNHQEEGRVWI